MPATMVHQDTVAVIDGLKWNKTHVFAGGVPGTVLVWDAGATSKASFAKSIGLNATLPVGDGQISTILGANNLTGITMWRATDVSATGFFYGFFSQGGGTLLASVDIHGNSLATSHSSPVVISTEKYIGQGDLGARIALAIAALPAGGGIVDGRDATDAQTVTGNVFSGNTKPVTVLLGAYTTTVTISATGVSGFQCTNNVAIRGLGEGITIIEGGTWNNANRGIHGIIEVPGGVSNVEISDLTIKSSAAQIAAGQLMGGGIWIGTWTGAGATKVRVHDVTFDHVLHIGASLLITESSHVTGWNLTITTWPFYEAETPPTIPETPMAVPGGHAVRVHNQASVDCHHEFRNITVINGGFGFSLLYANFVRLDGLRAITADLGDGAGDGFDRTFEGVNHVQSSNVTYDRLYIRGRGDAGFLIADGDSAGSGSNNVKLNGALIDACRIGAIVCGVDCVYENVTTRNNRGTYGIQVISGGGYVSTRVVVRNTTSYDDQGGGATQINGFGINAGATDTVLQNCTTWGCSVDFLDGGTDTQFVGLVDPTDANPAMRSSRTVFGPSPAATSVTDQVITTGALAGLATHDRTDTTRWWSIRANRFAGVDTTWLRFYNSVANAEVLAISTNGDVVMNAGRALGLAGDTSLTFSAANANVNALSITVAANTQGSGTSTTVKATSSFTGTGGTAISAHLAPSFAPTATSTLAGIGLYINPTINFQHATPGAGSYVGLQIDAVEVALPDPSTASFLILARNGNPATTVRFSVSRLGVISGAALTLAADAAILWTSRGYLETSGTSGFFDFYNSARTKNLKVRLADNEALFEYAGYSLTGSDASPLLDYSGTLNTSGVVDVVKVSLTNTASGAGSRLANFLVGGISRWSLDPSGAVIQNANAAALPAGIGGELLSLGQADGTVTRITMDSFAVQNVITARRANTTNASKSGLVNADVILSIAGRGYGATGYGNPRASVNFQATETWSDSAQGALVIISGTPNGGTATAGVMVLQNGVYIGAATGGDKGAGTLNLASTYYANNVAGVSHTMSGSITALVSTSGIVTTFTSSSDERLKLIEPGFPYGMRELRAIRPIRYRWNEYARETLRLDGGYRFGFSAQNLHECMPLSVGRERWEDGREWLTIDDRAVAGATVVAVQELDEEVRWLKARLAELEARA
jgi:hypothetical protein